VNDAPQLFTPDPARLADGWEFRFVADGTRTDEVVELYRAIGLDVCADPLSEAQLAEHCRDCQLVAALRFRMVYTRPRIGT
jgi:hypothetical protein